MRDNLIGGTVISLLLILIIFNVLMSISMSSTLDRMNQELDSIQVVVDSTQINTDYMRYD